MRSQEAGNGREVILEAAEEAILPHLGWRAEARSKASLCIKGGILADHPGFGKTITSLSLIYADFVDHANAPDLHKAITERMSPLSVDASQSPIKIAATLVILPKTITKQWYEEVGHVLGREYQKKTLLIEDMKDLNKYSVQHFRDARIILLNRGIIGRESYLQRVAKFAGLPEYGPATKKRDFKTWLELAVPKVAEHANILTSKGSSVLSKTIKEETKERLCNRTVRTFASKRLKGQAYVEKGQNKSRHAEKEADLERTISTPSARELSGCVLFEMFHYNRIIVDEFSYLLDNEGGSMTSMTTLSADKRWALSATPPLKDAYDVAQLARVIGIPLSRGFSMPGLLSAKNLAALQEDMTNVELFEMFSEAPSYIMLGRIHELAQKFLDAFVRQNILQFADFRYDDHIVPVHLNLDHRIVYNELSQQLNSQDMRIKRSSKKSVEGQDREEHIHDSVRGLKLAEQALSNRATFFSSIELGHKHGGIHALLEKRREQCDIHKSEIRHAIDVNRLLSSKLRGEERPFEEWQKTNLDSDEIGDQGVSDTIKTMIAAARPVTKALEVSDEERSEDETSDDGGKSKKKKKSKESRPVLDQARAKRAKLNFLVKKLLAVTRSIRFVENARRLHGAQEEGKEVDRCDFQDCAGNRAFSQLSAASVCGHIVCDACYQKSQLLVGNCGAPGCRNTLQEFQLLKAKKLVSVNEASANPQDQSQKIAAVIEILRRIQEVRQQAILFVRQHEHIETVQAALETNGIRSEAINKETAKRIEDFQRTQAVDKKTVIIINADDESAAGTNLTNANHVIFLSPLLKLDQYGYESQMAQAIGRVRRPGQKNDIFVYRMASLYTIDIDVLEHRERRDRILMEKKPNEVCGSKDPASREDIDMDAVDTITAPFTAEETSQTAERTQLIKDCDGRFKLVPKSLLLRRPESEGTVDIQGRARVKGFEEYIALIKFSKAYNADD
ncbi:hypothetical protein AAFC00_001182 [Neodothiora populina]|uniref:Helicase C-terminal domain-containing protein n=1 Tax=Neodothiora populina TaxID=2781224 RepID=A0ABR3PN42_9PEZI